MIIGDVLLVIERGGKNEERLYLYDLKLDCEDDICIIRKTNMPDMDNLISRHKGRYYLPAMFCRPNMIILDFPCGSGYGSQIIPSFYYEGRDNDEVTIEYAKNFYKKVFIVDDLKNSHLRDRSYDLIACIEGLEHIEQIYQKRLIKSFYDALVHGGVLVITSPERKEQITNPYHKWELTKDEFGTLLKEQFENVQILNVRDIDHKGDRTNFMYGICRKED